MKKVLIAAVFCVSFLFSKAQENKGDLLKLSIGVLNKIRLTYEHPLANAFSVGASGNFYYGEFPGFKVEPFVRYYIGGECPSGLYFQGRFLYGSFKKDFIYYRNGDLSQPNLSLNPGTSVSSTGGGIDIGYQWLSGRNNNIAIDLSLGVQAMKDINNTIVQSGVSYSTINAGFLTTGPGGVFNPHLSIGYKF